MFTRKYKTSFKHNNIKQLFQLCMVTIQEHTHGFDLKKPNKQTKNSFGIQNCTSILGCIKNLADYHQSWEESSSFLNSCKTRSPPFSKGMLSLETLEKVLEIGALIKRYRMSRCLDFNTLTQ